MSTTWNSVTAPVNRLRQLLAASAAFRTWCGAANETAALARIYRGTVIGPVVRRPFAVVYAPDAVAVDRDLEDAGVGVPAVTVEVEFQGLVTAELAAACTAAGDDWPALEPFGQAVDQAMQEVMSASQVGTGSEQWFPVQGYSLLDWGRVDNRDVTQVGDYLAASFVVTMGVIR